MTRRETFQATVSTGGGRRPIAQGSVGAVSAQPGVAAKTERLLNLVIALLSTRRPLTRQQIRVAVPSYQQTASDEAFQRMFERDKDELRELGIPLVTQQLDANHDDQLGYRIDRREYALPEITFTPDEVVALALAGRAWTRASLAGAASAALSKLAAAGVELDDASLVGVEPQVRTSEPAFEPIRGALQRRQAVRFTYRRADGATAERVVQPWGLTMWRSRWYLTGFDTERQAERLFRLSRVVGTVRAVGRAAAYEIPEGHEPRMVVQAAESTPVEQPPAVLRVRAGAGNSLRRRARTVGEVDDQWSLLDVDYTDTAALAQEVAGFGPDVVVEAPPRLRHAVIGLLRAARDAHPATPAGVP